MRDFPLYAIQKICTLQIEVEKHLQRTDASIAA